MTPRIFFVLFNEGFHHLILLGYINCVRWNPNGDMLASASNDGTVKILDFKTEKDLHTEAISDRSKFLMLNLHYLLLLLALATSVCFI